MKVSACIITYNHQDYIRECLEGALAQIVDFDYEIVIGEDKSPDGTLAICEEFAARYPEKIRLIKREENLGMIGNWIETIKACTGKYIALCEGDDYWTDPLKLQKQVDFMEENEEFVLTSHKSKLTENEDASNTIVLDWQTQSLVFRNILGIEFFNDFPPILNADTFLLRYLTNFGKFKLLNFTGSVYRLTGSGVWTSLSSVEKTDKIMKSYHQMHLFFKKYGYSRTAHEMKCWIYDLKFNKLRKTAEFSHKDFFTLSIEVLCLRDINRFKSLLLIHPVLRKITTRC